MRKTYQSEQEEWERQQQMSAPEFDILEDDFPQATDVTTEGM
jgi:hypothetical protein